MDERLRKRLTKKTDRRMILMGVISVCVACVLFVPVWLFAMESQSVPVRRVPVRQGLSDFNDWHSTPKEMYERAHEQQMKWRREHPDYRDPIELPEDDWQEGDPIVFGGNE